MFKRILTYSILSLIALGGFFGNVNIDIQSIHNISEISVEFTGNNTYADENGDGGAGGSMGTAPTDTKSTDPKKDVLSTTSLTMYNNLIDNINIVLGVLSTMITPVILFVGWLMSPDWTSGDLFGLRAPMYALWVTVSNIVYFIYAILLIIIALGTMFGHGTFSYKVMLPKLALGIIMVPFTWWFVQWTISISSVVTATVMTMPADTIGTNDSAWFTKPSIPTMIIVDNTGTGTENYKVECDQAATEGPCISPKSFIKNAGGMYSPLIIYGYSIFKFEKIKRLEGPLDIASAALQIVHTSIISTIMFAVFGLLTIALAAMLLMRAMKLWMYAIFAPLFTFRFVAGSNLLGGKDDSFSIKEFIGLAFVPAVVGLTLSFGLIIINAVQGPANSGPATSTPCNLEGEGCTILNIMGGDKNKITRKITDVNDKKVTSTIFAFGGVEFYFLGKATNQTSTTTSAPGAIDALGGMFGTLIIDVIALVFIWMSFMAAKKVSTAVEAAFEPFEKIGSQVGTLAKSLPKYTPLPIPGGSISGLGKVAAMPEQLMSQRASEKTKGIEEKMGRLFGVSSLSYGVAEQDKMKHYLDAKIGSTELANIKQLSAGVKDKSIDPGTTTGQSFINDNAAALKKALSDGTLVRIEGYNNDAQIKAAADGSESDKKKLVASWLADKHITSEGDAIRFFKEKGGATAGGNSTSSPSSIGVRLAGTEKVNISIGGSDFTIENIAGKKDITFGTDDSIKLKGKKAGMTAENFKKSLMNSGTMTDEAAENLIQKIKNDHKDFFDKSSS